MEPFAIFRYELTAELYQQMTFEAIMREPAWQKAIAEARRNQWVGLGLAVLGLGLLAWGVLMFRPKTELESTFGSIALGLVCVGLGTWMAIQKRLWLRRVLKGEYVASIASHHFGPRTFEYSERGAIYDDGHTRTEYRWGMFIETRRLPSFVVLLGVDRMCFMTPRSQFASLQDEDRFVARIDELLAQQGASVRERLRAFIARNDAPCRGCKYNLRGSESECCPECGRTIVLSDFPHVTAAPVQAAPASPPTPSPSPSSTPSSAQSP